MLSQQKVYLHKDKWHITGAEVERQIPGNANHFYNDAENKTKPSSIVFVPLKLLMSVATYPGQHCTTKHNY